MHRFALAGQGRDPMDTLKDQAVQLARRTFKGAAAIGLHYSGARTLLAAVQRRAVGGRRVLILGYHRVVEDFAAEKDRSLFSLNISRETFRRHLEQLAERWDLVSLEDAVAVLDGTRAARRDVAVITFDDGYRDVYTHALPVMRELKVPGIVYVPSSFIGTERRLGHDRIWSALSLMDRRGIGPMAVGVGGELESWLTDAFSGGAGPHAALERLVAKHPTSKLNQLAEALEDRLGLPARPSSDGEVPVTWEMLREMAAYGIETGAHTAEHTVLTHQPLAEARREIAQCKAAIEKHVERPVRHFAYCNGYYSPGVAQALKAEGFVTGVTTEDMPNMPGVDLFALKRKVLWEVSSTGMLGGYSGALTACQFDDIFGMFGLHKPVPGARPTRVDADHAPQREPLTAHG